MVMLTWIAAAAAAGLAAGPRTRAVVFRRSTEPGEPPRAACPACDRVVVPARRWWSVLPPSGRCPGCGHRIGPYPLAVELAAAAAMAAVLARSSLPWQAAALSWLVLTGVPLVSIDLAVRRLPDPLTAAAFAGTAGLLAAAALAGHEISALGRAGAGAGALAGVYLAITLAIPGGMGLGDLLTELRWRFPQPLGVRSSGTGGGS